MKKIQSWNKGFTLIELIIVIAIIGVLAGMVVTNFTSAQKKARDAQRKSDLRQIQSALEIYRSDIGSYLDASSLANCPASGTKTSLGNSNCTVTYMQTVPTDPKNTGQYIYTYSTSDSGRTYSLFACLENVNDGQKDAANNTTYCTGETTNWSFTLNNP